MIDISSKDGWYKLFFDVIGNLESTVGCTLPSQHILHLEICGIADKCTVIETVSSKYKRPSDISGWLRRMAESKSKELGPFDWIPTLYYTLSESELFFKMVREAAIEERLERI